MNRMVESDAFFGQIFGETYDKPRRVFTYSPIYFSGLALHRMCTWLRRKPSQLPTRGRV